LDAGRGVSAERSGGLASVRFDTLPLACVRLFRALGPGLALLARPPIAGLVALAIYLVRAGIRTDGFRHTDAAYFNFLADAFLHGQLSLRLLPLNHLDLTFYGDRAYLYWPPFPALLVMPLVALFGVGVSDVAYTAVFGAITIALLAKLLEVLDRTDVAPLSVERRGIVVATCAFGSVLLFLAPMGGVWSTGQLVGWGCILLATLPALTQRGRAAYLLTGLGLACAVATRIGLLFNGVWLAYYLLHRDRHQPLRQRVAAATLGLAPVVAMLLLLGGYNVARFGSPLETGLAWQNVGDSFRATLAQYGQFNVHYLPRNLYYHFVGYTLFARDQWQGGGLFWMTPVLLGAPYELWRGRRSMLVWILVLSCVLVYIPIGLLIGTGYFTFGPRYLLDLMVPIVVLTARGIRRWPLAILQVLMFISCATYFLGSWMSLVVP
jgi:hypothetical protein